MATTPGRNIAGAGGFLDSSALANVRQQLASNPVAKVYAPTQAPVRPDPIETLKANAQQASLISRLASTNRWGQEMTALKRQALAKQGAGALRQPSRIQIAQPRQQGRVARPVSRNVQGGHPGASPGSGRNGQLDINSLARLSWAGGHMADRRAAAAMEQLNAAYRAATGRNIGMTDSYRTLQGQHNLKRTKPGLSAVPGTSNHGWGKAFDLNVKGDPMLKRWLDENAKRYGIVNPAWAKNPKRFEPWHWEFIG